MYSSNKIYHSQKPHTDYDYKFKKKDDGMNHKQHYGWTALVPLSKEGSWLHVWFGTGYGRNLHIPHGKGFLFRSDVVHAGGRIEFFQSVEEKYHRLHFYLGTKFQVANPDTINYWHHDLQTELSSIYWVPGQVGALPSSSDKEAEEYGEDEENDEEDEEGEEEDNDEEEDMPQKKKQVKGTNKQKRQQKKKAKVTPKEKEEGKPKKASKGKGKN
jgi:hypothetical protein